MANRTGVDVEGLSEVTRALQQTAQEVEDPKDGLSRVASEGARITAGFAKRVSGVLAGSVRGENTRGRAVITAWAIYAGPNNYGWPSRNIAASGFMQKGDAVLQGRAVQLIEDNVNQIIREKRFE